MTTDEIIGSLPRISGLIIGDICLDRWCTYDPSLSEPSRETGLPRVAVVSTEVTPGGGGTVANNAAALGLKNVGVLGLAGRDGFGWELLQALRARRIDTAGMVESEEYTTFTYSKLLNANTGEEDLPRLDFVQSRPISAGLECEIVSRLHDLERSYDVLFVADQSETPAGGVVTGAVREALAAIARRNPVKVIWADSRVRMDLFRNVIVKVNQQEAAEACMRRFGEADFSRLRNHLESPLLFVTSGAEGVRVIAPDQEAWVRTRTIREPVDICGAGDSFSAAAASALAVGARPKEAARFGNLAASITIMKRGTGTASPEELRAAVKADLAAGAASGTD